MKKGYLKFKSWLLTLAAAALGISCTECAVEYGTPEATYHVKGTVSDPDGRPIPGIEVNHYGHPYDTTDPQGAYAFTLKGAFPSLPIDNVTFADIDRQLPRHHGQHSHCGRTPQWRQRPLELRPGTSKL